jgi:hypothetical protein
MGDPVPSLIKCSQGHENPAEAKFCGDCGETLNDGPVVCSLGHENPPGTHFCEECGAALPGAVVTKSVGARLRTWFSVGRNRVIAVGGVAVVVVAIVLLLVLSGGGSSTHTITGHLTLTDSDTATSNCVGQDGYSDIDEGANITITNESGTVIGSASLGAGTNSSGDDCVYPFTA